MQADSPIIVTPNRPPKSQNLYEDSSDDEGSFFNHQESLKDFDSVSSSNSITTEANCDFEFYQGTRTSFRNRNVPVNPTSKPLKHVSNTKITRSNSRRSLENLQAFIDVSVPPPGNKVSKVVLQRSNSYTTLEDKRKRRKQRKSVSRSNSKVSEAVKVSSVPQSPRVWNKKVKSVEYLPHLSSNAGFIEDMRNNNLKHVGNSVPDFKKVFISDYI